MPSVVVVGMQWGDEGKGKIVDILAEKADIVARYQGGNNAGHTVVIGGKKFVMHLVPTGILHPSPDKVCVIGNGTLIDLEVLFEEISQLKSEGIPIEGRLLISPNAHLIMPYHRLLDSLCEDKGNTRIGTTRRGIGPAYVDKMARSGIKVEDLLDGSFESKLNENIKEKNKIFEKIYGVDGLGAEDILRDYRSYSERIRPFVADTHIYLNRALDEGKNVVFEGAQGTMLDVDFGTYPYVTSSNPTAGGACTGLGVSPMRIDGIIGVMKAYTTRVGEGPFPTELADSLGGTIRERGGEFGATTGRPRRCGWFDAVAARYAAMINGATDLAITKLDVLDGLDPIKVCTAYRCEGTEMRDFPSSLRILKRCEPIYEELPGWRKSTAGITSYADLPVEARNYLKFVEESVGVRIALVSTGADRKETIVLDGRCIEFEFGGKMA
ncbi:MAG: adenylosuccinate synthase [bacterium]